MRLLKNQVKVLGKDKASSIASVIGGAPKAMTLSGIFLDVEPAGYGVDEAAGVNA